MKTTGKGKISYVLQTITILPLLLFCLVILFIGTQSFTKAMHSEVEVELRNVSGNLIALFDALYPGDYTLVEDTDFKLYKGNCDLTGDYSLIDSIKADTGMEVTLFYQDTRVLTTITSKYGQRITGSAAPSEVVEDVLRTGEPGFYKKTLIYGSTYFSYYVPLHNEDGSIVGMLFVGKPSAEVNALVRHSLSPLLIAGVVLAILSSVLVSLYTKHFVLVLMNIHSFLKEVSTGNLDASLSPAVTRRNDELGEIGLSALTMQRSLYTLVEQDALTNLPNRRSGDKKLRQAMKNFAEDNRPFCVAIGDIDFFKTVNDTYGHECGDLVLKNVSSVLRSHMQEIGSAARWGGEEFLLVFENTGLESARKSLDELMEKIRALESDYDGQPVKVTMTFGITLGSADDANKILRIADEKLYQGKTGGRNKIVF